MTTDIVSKPTVTPEKYALVKEQFARGCTDGEFQVFLELANRYQLDPFARQIWAVKGYGSTPAQIIVARDGYLAVAHRSGQFDGMSDPEYTCDDKGTVTSVKVRVYRKDMSHPFTGEAWDDEDNLHQSVWNKRQRTMLL
ncbi:MAG TPA: recombinase RecT, partial [Methanocorpusculum sp.]|nr:recombinase RecT [Methanocorpusculum sp.]